MDYLCVSDAQAQKGHKGGGANNGVLFLVCFATPSEMLTHIFVARTVRLITSLAHRKPFLIAPVYDNLFGYAPFWGDFTAMRMPMKAVPKLPIHPRGAVHATNQSVLYRRRCRLECKRVHVSEGCPSERLIRGLRNKCLSNA